MVMLEIKLMVENEKDLWVYLFSLEDKDELTNWSDNFASVSAKSYMRGYRDIYKKVSFFHKLMIKFCDSFVKMQIIKITFR